MSPESPAGANHRQDRIPCTPSFSGISPENPLLLAIFATVETLVRAIEIFALLTGLPYIVLEVLQKNAMWWFGIATGLACAVSFGVQHLWASMGLNIYYVAISFWGLHQWRKDRLRLEAGLGEVSRSSTTSQAQVSSSAPMEERGGVDELGAKVHLNRLSVRTAVTSAGIFIGGTILLVALLRLLGGSETSLDAAIAVMSAVATFWLAKSYRQHWCIWLLADALCTFLCFKSGLYWMTALYLAYAASALAGMRHWRRNGAYVS